jgi:hypothetical protein
MNRPGGESRRASHSVPPPTVGTSRSSPIVSQNTRSFMAAKERGIKSVGWNVTSAVTASSRVEADLLAAQKAAGQGLQMPKIDSHKVDEGGIATITQWINQGCK